MNRIFLGEPPENIKQWIIDDYNRKQEEKLKIPLCFEAVDAGATIALKCNGNNLKTATFQTSTDGQTWSDYTYETNITLTNAGDKVYFKAKTDNTSIARDFDNHLQFMTTQDEKKVKVSGNVMSLLSPEFSQMKSVGSFCFYCLFYNSNISDCSSLILPATTLANGCYNSVFSGCSSLTQAPALPATTLAIGCYECMFSRCSNLTQAPALPATTLADACYIYMFNGCSNLTQAPEIKTYTPDLNTVGAMLCVIDDSTGKWGKLTTCTWNDLTLAEVEGMVLESMFGYDNPGDGVRINIICKDGSGVAYYDSARYSWVFEH